MLEVNDFDAVRISLASPELQERICLEEARPISMASKLLMSIKSIPSWCL